MDNKALYNLTYGVFMLATKQDDKVNGCITNTCMQVANSPARVAISCINANYTCELIKQSGVFALTLLDETCDFATIKHFGMQSGRDVDKFTGEFDLSGLPVDINHIPYLKDHACSVISCKVLESHDLGSHTLFIAEIVDAVLLNDKKPLTYADYQGRVKPKPDTAKTESSEKKIVGWKCKICGYIYEGSELPADYVCPVCGHPAEDFEPIYE
ncbi:MAG: flavin reductase [Lachnospiraceae bacterium]|nr:flavin reductase [Lachnospiraceae bacterium]